MALALFTTVKGSDHKEYNYRGSQSHFSTEAAIGEWEKDMSLASAFPGTALNRSRQHNSQLRGSGLGFRNDAQRLVASSTDKA